MLLNFATWRCYPRNLRQNYQEKRCWVTKINASKRLVCWLENLHFHFQKLLCKCSWSHDKIWPQKLIQNSSSDYEVTFARNSLICGNVPVGTYKHFWIPRSSHDLFIGDEDIYCQCMIFHHCASIWYISLLAVHPLISNTLRSDLRFARRKIVKKQWEVSDNLD